MTATASLAIIGGSGLYDMTDLKDKTEINLDTPFGGTSSPINIGNFDGLPVAFLARHGIGHHITPSEVPYRANIFALKLLGVERIVSVSACGSLRDEIAPGDIVIPDQIYDHTKNRERSFFGEGLVAHVGVADPYCPDLSSQLSTAVRAAGARTHQGGSLITIEGPRFSTKAESNTFRSWGMAIIGMTACPEAFLAREAEICYTTMAHVTDYDVWHVSEAPVTVEMVIQTLYKNTEVAQKSIQYLIRSLNRERVCSCATSLSNALITNPETIRPEILSRLKPLVEKYYNTKSTA